MEDSSENQKMYRCNAQAEDDDVFMVSSIPWLLLFCSWFTINCNLEFKKTTTFNLIHRHWSYHSSRLNRGHRLEMVVKVRYLFYS